MHTSSAYARAVTKPKGIYMRGLELQQRFQLRRACWSEMPQLSHHPGTAADSPSPMSASAVSVACLQFCSLVLFFPFSLLAIVGGRRSDIWHPNPSSSPVSCNRKNARYLPISNRPPHTTVVSNWLCLSLFVTITIRLNMPTLGRRNGRITVGFPFQQFIRHSHPPTCRVTPGITARCSQVCLLLLLRLHGSLMRTKWVRRVDLGSRQSHWQSVLGHGSRPFTLQRIRTLRVCRASTSP
ncbi:hypothetical protein F4802DRAFT_5216 [Xylaria palmicola]|nr:hypothetical protein F4802DRAFT_5216 [Xylaria palmicola]